MNLGFRRGLYLDLQDGGQDVRAENPAQERPHASGLEPRMISWLAY